MYDRRPASTAWSIAFAPAPKPEAAILGSFQFAISHLHNQPVHTGRSDNIGGFPARFKRNRTSAIFEQQLSRARFGVAVRNIAAHAVRHVHAPPVRRAAPAASGPRHLAPGAARYFGCALAKRRANAPYAEIGRAEWREGVW